jgi:hypothetical protein
LAIVDPIPVASSQPPIYEVITRALESEDALMDFFEVTGFLNTSPNWRFGQVSPEAVRNFYARDFRIHRFVAELGRLLGGRSEDSVLWQIVWRLRGWSGMPVIRNNILYDIPRPWSHSNVASWLSRKSTGLRDCGRSHGDFETRDVLLHTEEALQEVITRFVDSRGLDSPYELIK